MRLRYLLAILSIFVVFALDAIAVPSLQLRTQSNASFYSNGDLIQGWYWLRDPRLQHYARWRLKNVMVGPRGLILSINALATNRTSGGPGVNGEFELRYGSDPSVTEGFGGRTTIVHLRNVSSPDDPVGYTNEGRLPLAVDALGPPNSRITLYLRAERHNAYEPHMAFNAQSMRVGIGAAQETTIGASAFQSNGDLIQTWYWLRDETLQRFATWTFNDVPVTASGVRLTITELATDRTNGGPGIDGQFVLRYGTSPSVVAGRGGRTINVRTRNISRANDPVGYTNTTTLTLPAKALGGANHIATLYLRVERSNPNGPHVAFRADAMRITVAGDNR